MLMTRTIRSIRSTEVSGATPEARGPAPATVEPLSPKQRQPSWVVLGVVLVGVAALLGAWIFIATSDQIAVMVAARDIEPGEVIEATDLQVIEIGGSVDMRAVQRDQQDLVVGLAARGPIPEGTVMNTGLVAPRDRVIPAGWAVVGASLPRGAIPSTDLIVGDRVDLLRTTQRAGAPDESPLTASRITAGTVWSVRPPEASSVSAETWVALLVPTDTREPVAQAASEGLLALALLGAEP